MSYTITNFKSKKQLKNAVDMYKASLVGKIKDKTCSPVKCYNPGLGPDLSNFTGNICLEGPHYPSAHTWYAEATLENGIVVKVK